MLKYNVIKSNENISLNIIIEDKNKFTDNNHKLDFDEVKTNENFNNESIIYKNIIPLNITLNFLYERFYYPDFIYTGFNLDEITQRKENFRYSSLYIYLYDKKEISSQNLVHISYLPLYYFNNLITSTLVTNLVDEYNYFYVNENFGTNIFLYARFYFFNAKTGKLIPFINSDNTLINDDKLYHKVYINENKEAFFLNQNINLNEINNTEYIEKINRLDKNANILPILEKDKIFTIDGKYI